MDSVARGTVINLVTRALGGTSPGALGKLPAISLAELAALVPGVAQAEYRCEQLTGMFGATVALFRSKRNVLSTYGEINAPLISPDMNIQPIARISLE